MKKENWKKCNLIKQFEQNISSNWGLQMTGINRIWVYK